MNEILHENVHFYLCNHMGNYLDQCVGETKGYSDISETNAMSEGSNDDSNALQNKIQR